MESAATAISITNLPGEQMGVPAKATTKGLEVNTVALPPGVYTLSLRDGHKQKRVLFVKE